jgi:hypothetical protein
MPGKRKAGWIATASPARATPQSRYDPCVQAGHVHGPNRREVLAGAAAVVPSLALLLSRHPHVARRARRVCRHSVAAVRHQVHYVRAVCLEHCAPEAGLSPEFYGEEIGRALRYADFAGWAFQTETGRLRITDVGRREYELSAARIGGAPKRGTP